jgi:hypothetical protein
MTRERQTHIVLKSLYLGRAPFRVCEACGEKVAGKSAQEYGTCSHLPAIGVMCLTLKSAASADRQHPP